MTNLIIVELFGKEIQDILADIRDLRKELNQLLKRRTRSLHVKIYINSKILVINQRIADLERCIIEENSGGGINMNYLLQLNGRFRSIIMPIIRQPRMKTELPKSQGRTQK